MCLAAKPVRTERSEMGVSCRRVSAVRPQRILIGRVPGCLIPLVTLALVPGCVTGAGRHRPADAAIVAAAKPILTLDPEAVWTERYNQLVARGTESLRYLAEHPRLQRPAAPDDLAVMVHLNLLRLLAHPAMQPPRLSATCLETTLDVLHCDIRVSGKPIGKLVWLDGATVSAWHDLYPEDFDHGRAARVNVERDRRAMLAWWKRALSRGWPLAVRGRLTPQARHLWSVMSRYRADRWNYLPNRGVTHCGSVGRPSLLGGLRRDYNLVRASCIWLGTRNLPAVQTQLIELVGSSVPAASYNARFALRRSPNGAIRALIERFDAERGSSGQAGRDKKQPWLRF